MQNYRGQNFRVGYRGNYRNDSFKEVEVDLEKDNIQVILEGMIKAAVVHQDQVQMPVLIGIVLDVFNVGNMIILLKTA